MITKNVCNGSNFVNTPLYQRNKKLQVNNLLTNPAVVFRADTHHGKQKRWTRSTQNKVKVSEKGSYPSYSHFHHQYSQTNPTSPQSNSSSFPSTSHYTKEQIRLKCDDDDQQNVKRLFHKLEIRSRKSSSSSDSSSTSYLTISNEVTHLQLNPTFSSTFMNPVISSRSSSISPSDSSSYASPQNFNNRCSFNSQEEFNTDFDQESYISEENTDVESLRFDSPNDEASESASENEGTIVSETENREHTCPDEIQCIMFRNGRCFDDKQERREVLKWYDELIQWRHDIVTKRRFGPPRCHPPPLTITIIGASRAQRPNPFQKVIETHPFQMELMDHARYRIESRKSQNLVPYQLPLPAPHEFMANAKCMEPHLFVEYCYQLTAAAYIDVGLNPPTRRPPIPPPIEPFPEQLTHDSICSSASDFSSDGEYSDDSEETKNERLRQKMERHKRRRNRLKQIFRRRAAESSVLEDIDEEDN